MKSGQAIHRARHSLRRNQPLINKLTNVEATAGEDTRHTRQHTRLILDETVEEVTLERLGARGRGVVENVGDGLLSAGGTGVVSGSKVRRALRGVVELVCRWSAGHSTVRARRREALLHRHDPTRLGRAVSREERSGRFLMLTVQSTGRVVDGLGASWLESGSRGAESTSREGDAAEAGEGHC